MLKTFHGDVLSSTADCILHQVNCKGTFGAGLALQIKKKYPMVYEQYKAYCFGVKPTSKLLGNVLYTPLNDKQCIANLFAQDGFAAYGLGTVRFTDYDALEKCLKDVNGKYKGRTVALPHGLGCGLAGGSWERVYPIVERCLVDCNVEIWRLPVF